MTNTLTVLHAREADAERRFTAHAETRARRTERGQSVGRPTFRPRRVPWLP